MHLEGFRPAAKTVFHPQGSITVTVPSLASMRTRSACNLDFFFYLLGGREGGREAEGGGGVLVSSLGL